MNVPDEKAWLRFNGGDFLVELITDMDCDESEIALALHQIAETDRRMASPVRHECPACERRSAGEGLLCHRCTEEKEEQEPGHWLLGGDFVDAF